MSYFKKLISDPGVIFPWGNIFAIIQSGSFLGTAISVATAIAATASRTVELYTSDPAHAHSRLTKTINNLKRTLPGSVRTQFLPLRIAGIGIFCAGAVTGISALTTGSLIKVILPVIAAGSFTAGDVLLSSPLAKEIQKTVTKGWKKATTHAGVYFGIGYAATGLMAGGGLGLFNHVASHVPALMATSLGVATTTVTTIGMVSGRLKSSRPYAFLSAGGVINAVAGIVSGNLLGTVNNLFSAAGEARISQIVSAEARLAAAPSNFADPVPAYEKTTRRTNKQTAGIRPAARLTSTPQAARTQAEATPSQPVLEKSRIGAAQKNNRQNNFEL